MKYLVGSLKKILSLLVLTFFSIGTQAQEALFWNDIQAFKKQDSLIAPSPGAILFIGSSSFTNWKDVQSYFPEYPIINRGFGGSTLKDVIYYFDDVVKPYHPKQVIIYCGENDLAESGETTSAETVFTRFKQLYTLLREELGDLDIAYVSIKPSPSRQHLMPKMIEANRLIQNFIEKEGNTVFIDVFSKMLDSDGLPKEEIFVADRLHLNEKGYLIWKKEIGPVFKSWN